MPKIETIHLVSPLVLNGVTGDTPFAPPLNLAILAGLTPEEINVYITDENVGSSVDFDKPADLVGITALTSTVTRAYELADAFRKRGTRVVMGGIHPTALPEEALQHADTVVVGEAEGLWPQLLDDLQEDRLRQIYCSIERSNLKNLPHPRHDLLQRNGYMFPDTIYTTRGCPNGCGFCSVTSFFGGTYRSRPTEEVLAEVNKLPGKTAFFIDDNIAGHIGNAGRLFQGLTAREKRLTWIGQASVTIARNEELLDAAAASGCLALLLGIESLSPENLKSVGKHCNKVDEYEEAIKRIHARGIAVLGAFIFGLDHDTKDIFEQTLRFAQRNRLEGALFNILTPYPGTPLFADMEKAGRLRHRNWSQYRANNVVFEPTCMSAENLIEGRNWIEREFYSFGSIWERLGMPGDKRDFAKWLLNVNYRDDPFSKAIFKYGVPVVRRLFSF